MKKMKFWGALLLMLLVLARPEQSVAGAQRAMHLWTGSVAPALFPFLVLMPALTGPEACAFYNRAFSCIMEPIFGLPGSASPAVIIGMIAGSPGGAIAVSKVAAQSGMPKAHAQRIALAVCGLSPAYLIMGVGQGILGSVRAGVRLAAVQLFMQIAFLFALRFLPLKSESRADAREDSAGLPSVRHAVETILGVCGYMVFFSSVAAAASSFVGKRAGEYLLLLMDLPSGLPAAAESGMPFALGAAVGFGGLCIAMQNLDALRVVGVKAGSYFAVRSMNAILFGCVWKILWKEYPAVNGISGFIGKKAYAVSLICSMFFLIPMLISFSKKYFINKSNQQEKPGIYGDNFHI